MVIGHQRYTCSLTSTQQLLGVRLLIRFVLIIQASQLRRFAVYFDVGKPLWQPKKAWMDMLAYDWDQLFKQGIAANTTRPASPSGPEPSGADNRMYIVNPIDGQLQYLRRGRNVRQGEAEAIQEADFHLQSIAFHVSSMSFLSSWRCASEPSSHQNCFRYTHKHIVGAIGIDR